MCAQVSGVMRSLIRSIPTYKWLLVLPQLTSRMCHTHPDVQVRGQEGGQGGTGPQPLMSEVDDLGPSGMVNPATVPLPDP